MEALGATWAGCGRQGEQLAQCGFGPPTEKRVTAGSGGPRLDHRPG